MRRFDKIKKIEQANLLLEQRYLESKEIVNEDWKSIVAGGLALMGTFLMNAEKTQANTPTATSITTTPNVNKSEDSERLRAFKQKMGFELNRLLKQTNNDEIKRLATDIQNLKEIDEDKLKAYVQLLIGFNNRVTKDQKINAILNNIQNADISNGDTAPLYEITKILHSELSNYVEPLQATMIILSLLLSLGAIIMAKRRNG